MKCFTVYAEEIEGRIDPLYYSTDVFQVIKKSSNPKRIEEVITYIKTGFAAGANLQSNDEGIIQIRPTNISQDNLLIFDKNVYLNKEIVKEKKNEMLKKEEILFNNTNSQELVGKTAYFNLDGNYFCSNHITRIKADENIILPEYLWILLNVYQKRKVFFTLCTNWNNQSGINIELLKKVKIPLPNITKQKEIIKIFKESLDSKKQKENQAKELLESINDYVLKELGIKFPKLKDKMCFAVSSEEVRAGRLDAYYYQPKFEEVEKAVNKGNFKVNEIKTSLIMLNKLENIEEYDYINYVDLASIDKNFGLIKNKNRLEVKETPSRARQKLERGDLLISSLTGSLKSIAIFDGSFDNPICSTGFYVIKNSNKYNNHYLWTLFRSNFLQMILQRESSGAIMSAVNRNSLMNIKIPLPPINIQNKIAEEVKKRMKKAKKLKEEAKKEFNITKQKVEEMILGG